jgi:uncharacterized protein involved in cysteine biosynthesis
VALFLPQLRKYRPLVLAILSAVFLAYLAIAVQPQHRHGLFMLEPTIDDWVSIYGTYRFVALHGTPPVFLHTWVQVLLTIASFGGLLGLIASFLRTRETPPAADSSPKVSWKQLGVLLAPFTIAYILLLIPRAGTEVLFDRYLLGLLACIIHEGAAIAVLG